jgi:murein DD-endopeptidase MepM/ murein hydrolase activator NlpD
MEFASRRAWRRAIGAAGLLAFAFCGSDASSPGTAAATPTPTPTPVAICPPADGLSYVLPYPPPRSFLCSQGYVGYTGPYPHSSVFRYALDFDMPIGTVVTAARDGVVEFVEAGYPDGYSGVDTENVVVIDHGDGTYARYAHLTRNGALVRRGQSVKRGDPVGHSGSSGTPFPHLHFDVTRGCSTRECQTVPVCFSNTNAHPAGLETGVSYPARPY